MARVSFVCLLVTLALTCESARLGLSRCGEGEECSGSPPHCYGIQDSHGCCIMWYIPVEECCDLSKNAECGNAIGFGNSLLAQKNGGAYSLRAFEEHDCQGKIVESKVLELEKCIDDLNQGWMTYRMEGAAGSNTTMLV
eukprot:TRINITY_DN2831_c0_g1_i2.p2 TRINITY_DN2831_c0_g1~~TRINITY_DN2831_c0_g1_i2.p2  ORF type:complete len:139 (-),score=15.59 TRINITY_DN2831_c0_g1_i2:139-555(-)